MKNFIASLILMSLFICSCEKEGDVPNYVGNWSTEQSIDFMGVKTDITINMTINESSVESIGEMTIQEVQVPAYGTRADLLVDGQTFIMTLTSIGVATSGVMIWVEKGAQGWEEMLTQADLTETIEADYVVLGNKLTLNISGGLPQIYTRQ